MLILCEKSVTKYFPVNSPETVALFLQQNITYVSNIKALNGVKLRVLLSRIVVLSTST